MIGIARKGTGEGVFFCYLKRSTSRTEVACEYCAPKTMLPVTPILPGTGLTLNKNEGRVNIHLTWSFSPQVVRRTWIQRRLTFSEQKKNTYDPGSLAVCRLQKLTLELCDEKAEQ